MTQSYLSRKPAIIENPLNRLPANRQDVLESDPKMVFLPSLYDLIDSPSSLCLCLMPPRDCLLYFMKLFAT